MARASPNQNSLNMGLYLVSMTTIKTLQMI